MYYYRLQINWVSLTKKKFGRHKEHGHAAMLKKRKPSPTTLPLYSNLTFRTPTPEATFTLLLETPFQLEPPVNRLKRSEVQSIITNLPPNKSPGYDFIIGKTLKEWLGALSLCRNHCSCLPLSCRYLDVKEFWVLFDCPS
jgi:hypothetical protein